MSKNKAEQRKNGERVWFNNGVTEGTGIIRGIGGLELPVIGITYIVEVTESDIDPEVYDYPCVPMFDVHINDISEKKKKDEI